MATWVNLMDVLYPVGSIYQSASASSPASVIGGTWTQITGRFLLGQSSAYAGGSTGGEANHTLSINEMPTHDHSMRIQWGDGTGNIDAGANGGNKLKVDQGAATGSVGGGGAQQYASLLYSIYLAKNCLDACLEVVANA